MSSVLIKNRRVIGSVEIKIKEGVLKGRNPLEGLTFEYVIPKYDIDLYKRLGIMSTPYGHVVSESRMK